MPRGTPQITLQTLKVLSAMLEDPDAEHYGLEIGKRVGLKSGTLYPIFARIEGAQWVTSRWEHVDPSREGRPRRRLYRLTGLGILVASREVEAAKIGLRAQNPLPSFDPGTVTM